MATLGELSAKFLVEHGVHGVVGSFEKAKKTLEFGDVQFQLACAAVLHMSAVQQRKTYDAGAVGFLADCLRCELDAQPSTVIVGVLTALYHLFGQFSHDTEHGVITDDHVFPSMLSGINSHLATYKLSGPGKDLSVMHAALRLTLVRAHSIARSECLQAVIYFTMNAVMSFKADDMVQHFGVNSIAIFEMWTRHLHALDERRAPVRIVAHSLACNSQVNGGEHAPVDVCYVPGVPHMPAHVWARGHVRPDLRVVESA